MLAQFLEIHGRKVNPSNAGKDTEKCGHASTLRIGFEPKIPMSEKSKTVRGIDHAVTVSILFDFRFQLM
jgi:hypothetical protein